MPQPHIFKYTIGIDEVGRGPIAGPVAVGAFIFLNYASSLSRKLNSKLFRGVKESKQLTEKKREMWFKKICALRHDTDKNKDFDKNSIDFVVTFQSEKVIDNKGLSFAIRKCLETSLSKLIKKYKINSEEVLILLDGGLKAPLEYKNQKTIIKGDVKEKVIALASICAKVLRDRRMKKWAKKYPQYGFEIHKGYGTKRHYKAIKNSGLIHLHRKSFLSHLGRQSPIYIAKNRQIS